MPKVKEDIKLMEWLHFSDFHVGRDKGAYKEAMLTLVDFLQNHLENSLGIDAVFLAGDIAYSGQQHEYLTFENDFLKPLKDIPSLCNAKILAVPGNHDVDCDAASPITWDSIKERNQQIYFDEHDDGLRARRHRLQIFVNYADFVKRNNIFSPDPFSEVSRHFSDELGFPFDIVSINTAFFSDKDENSSEPITPCPLTSMRERLINSTNKKRPVIILGHHSQNCFIPNQQVQFETLLIDHKAVYLHGHEHCPKVTSNVNGTLRTLGFGATYIAALGAKSPQYKNSFVHCRFDNRLYLTGYAWDSEVGRWDDATRSQFSSCILKDNYDGKSVILDIPLLSGKNPSSPLTLGNIPRRIPIPQSIALVSLPSNRVWLKLLALSENINSFYKNILDPNVQSSREFDGKYYFVLEQAEKRDLLICIPGATHILSSKEVESYNTQIDTENYRSLTIVSLGTISTEAREMYIRLKSRKKIEILINPEIAAKWRELLSIAQGEILASCDAGKHSADILIEDDRIHLLIVETSDINAFRIIDPDGNTLSPNNSVVVKLREGNPLFSKLPYAGEISINKVNENKFDESEYFKKCYTENNVMKYAALANVGLRFSDFSLKDIYISASACEIEVGNTGRIDALLEDHLAPYPASEKLKEQIKKQFFNNKESERHETLKAREFCQKYGAVLLIGDPGSGKTCFVKSEILAYAKRVVEVDSSNDEWHSVHIPVMVQLSQAAAEVDIQTAGLLKIASRLLERRGLLFPFSEMEDFLKQGRLALFFDGLDEIVSVEKRALVVQHINDIVNMSLPLGNRVVVTSRPAAVNVVNLLPALQQLELQGLTINEIQALASKILTLKLSETSEGIVLDSKQARTSDSNIVRQLLNDCRTKPGVARLAQNPLLLTLLVMIYANSGAPSAKRHRIYEEAIKRSLLLEVGRPAMIPFLFRTFVNALVQLLFQCIEKNLAFYQR